MPLTKANVDMSVESTNIAIGAVNIKTMKASDCMSSRFICCRTFDNRTAGF